MRASPAQNAQHRQLRQLRLHNILTSQALAGHLEPSYMQPARAWLRSVRRVQGRRWFDRRLEHDLTGQVGCCLSKPANIRCRACRGPLPRRTMPGSGTVYSHRCTNSHSLGCDNGGNQAGRQIVTAAGLDSVLQNTHCQAHAFEILPPIRLGSSG